MVDAPRPRPRPARAFTVWQVVGGLLWSVGVTLAGYLLGRSIPNVDTYLMTPGQPLPQFSDPARLPPLSSGMGFII